MFCIFKINIVGSHFHAQNVLFPNLQSAPVLDCLQDGTMLFNMQYVTGTKSDHVIKLASIDNNVKHYLTSNLNTVSSSYLSLR